MCGMASSSIDIIESARSTVNMDQTLITRAIVISAVMPERCTAMISWEPWERDRRRARRTHQGHDLKLRDVLMGARDMGAGTRQS